MGKSFGIGSLGTKRVARHLLIPGSTARRSRPINGGGGLSSPSGAPAFRGGCSASSGKSVRLSFESSTTSGSSRSRRSLRQRRPAAKGVAHGGTPRHKTVVEQAAQSTNRPAGDPMALPTDQKAGGSTPSRRAETCSGLPIRIRQRLSLSLTLRRPD